MGYVVMFAGFASGGRFSLACWDYGAKINNLVATLDPAGFSDRRQSARAYNSTIIAPLPITR